MRTLDMIASENYSEYTAKEIEVMKVVRDETLEDLKHKLWEAGFDVAKVAEILSTFRRDNPR
jgi:hypothetical protein